MSSSSIAFSASQEPVHVDMANRSIKYSFLSTWEKEDRGKEERLKREV